MTTRKAQESRPVNGLVRPPSSYEEYLLLSEKDKLRLMRQSKKTKRPNSALCVKANNPTSGKAATP